MRYSIAAPCVGPEESNALVEAIREGEVSRGRATADFEESFSAMLGGGHAVSVVNGTAALEVALRALNVHGQEVVTGAMSCQATANALLAAGCTIRFVDHDERTWQVSVTEIERAITPQTKAIVVAHLYGSAANPAALLEVAKRHGIALVEDCSQSLGSSWNSQPIGTFGDVSTFSFYGNKLITTGEGGMLWSPYPEVAERARIIRSFGQTAPFHHTTYGLNWKMPNLLAAVGVQQLRRVPTLLEARRSRMRLLSRLLGSDPRIVLPENQNELKPSPFCFPVVLLDDNPTRVRDSLADREIETRPLFRPQFDQPYWREYAPLPEGDFPIARKLYERGFYLPCSPHLTEEDYGFIAECVLQTLSGKVEVETQRVAL
jgi:perosamine synthetase